MNMLECKKDNCKKRYIGETKRAIKHRLANHRGYIVNHHIDKATRAHFYLPGQSLSDLRCTLIAQVKEKNDLYRKERETYIINQFYTLQDGLNRRK